MAEPGSFLDLYIRNIAVTGLWTLAHTPLPVAHRLARLYATIFDRAIPRLRSVADENLTHAFPELDAAGRAGLIDGIYRSLARQLVTFSRFPRFNRDNIGELIRYEGFEHYIEAKKAGKGVLFATAHLGNWELSAFSHALLTEPMHVVVRPLDNPLLDELVERYRSLSGNWISGKRDAARLIYRALQRNQAVGILIDQHAVQDEGIPVEFFRRPAWTSPAFAKLAWRTEAAVLPGFAIWSEAEQRHILRFYPRVEMTGDAAADTQRIQSVLEGVIREYPDQWLWLHRRWKV